MKNQQIIEASILGTIAFKEGKFCSPASDPKLMAIIQNRAVGETPPKEAPTTKIMEAWIKSWRAASLANEWETSESSSTKNKLKFFHGLK